MTEPLSLEDLARWTGEPLERLEQWRSLGLIGAEGDGFTPEDLELAGLIQFVLRRGIDLEMLRQTAHELGPEMASYIRLLFPEGVPQPLSTAHVAETHGLDPAALRRLLAAAWPGRSTEYLYSDDLVVVNAVKVSLDAGIPESAIIELLKVYADALSRVAEAETRMTGSYLPRMTVTPDRISQQAISVYRDTIRAPLSAGHAPHRALPP